jgi:hypothetical protein
MEHCGFHAIDKIPNDTKIGNEYFLTYVLNPFEQAIFLQ